MNAFAVIADQLREASSDEKSLWRMAYGTD